MSGKIECGQSCLDIVNKYCPPGPTSSFFSQFQDILSYMASLYYNLVLMGDFNLHIDSLSSIIGQLTDIMESFDLTQYFYFPTHIHGHSLNIMMFSRGCQCQRWPPSILRGDGCTRLSRCRPGWVIWRSWSAQSPGPPSRRCWQCPTERQADTVGASAAAGVAGRCYNAWPSAFGAPLQGCVVLSINVLKFLTTFWLLLTRIFQKITVILFCKLWSTGS